MFCLIEINPFGQEKINIASYSYNLRATHFVSSKIDSQVKLTEGHSYNSDR